ncbi:MAG TPA: 50S ribosomal protein L4 [Methylomirabilota bacterium]|nr:50S ribosomal protein L4 [Methylomirabilota bacterium]
MPILDGKGKSSQTLEVPADVFGVTPRVPLLHQAVVKEMAARRAGTHSTRGRSQVSGGGRKPWKQKGTGRARQGSIRATQWKGGGKPFGPRPRKYAKQMPSEMRRAALREAVSAKIGAGQLSVVETLGVTDPKTRALTTRLKDLGITGQVTLVVVSRVTEELQRAARNVPWLVLETPGHVSVYQLIRHERVLFEKDALQTLERTLHPDGPIASPPAAEPAAAPAPARAPRAAKATATAKSPSKSPRRPRA